MHITSYVLPCVDVALLYRGLIVYINLNEQFDVGLFCILILSCSDLSVHWRVINLWPEVSPRYFLNLFFLSKNLENVIYIFFSWKFCIWGVGVWFGFVEKGKGSLSEFINIGYVIIIAYLKDICRDSFQEREYIQEICIFHSDFVIYTTLFWEKNALLGCYSFHVLQEMVVKTKIRQRFMWDIEMSWFDCSYLMNSFVLELLRADKIPSFPWETLLFPTKSAIGLGVSLTYCHLQ